jgi:hypothetical protein
MPAIYRHFTFQVSSGKLFFLQDEMWLYVGQIVSSICCGTTIQLSGSSFKMPAA